jgi:tRNA (cmo5U34)-methyltransferase
MIGSKTKLKPPLCGVGIYGVTPMSTSVDKDIEARNAGWTFEGISDSFEDHVSRSVPFYEQGHELVCKYSDFFIQNGSVIYDIGCSTGALTRKLLEWHSHRPQIEVIGIDLVADMIAMAEERGRQDSRGSFVCGDALTTDMKPADAVVSYYCLQFVPPRIRQNLFDKIFATLNWGGGFFLFEKVRAPDARFQDYAVQIYTDYKVDQGFTSDQIVNKTRSLKGVLEPFSTRGNLEMLQRAGFKDVVTIFKWVCFEGFLAIK